MVFAHGFGCDQNMWRYVWPALPRLSRSSCSITSARVGRTLRPTIRQRYCSLQGYADDVLDICHELDLSEVVFVGHSVSAMIGVLAADRGAGSVRSSGAGGPSPRYIDDDGYVGGFTHEDIDGLLESLESNYLGWSSAMAPVIMGNADRPELGEELTNSFCRADPEIAAQFARVTFLSDNRADLARVGMPSLVLQCSEDAIAPAGGRRVRAPHLRDSRLVLLEATGHCPNLSAPRGDNHGYQAILGLISDAAHLRGHAEELFEDAPCGYVSTRPDGTIIQVNRTFEAWTGSRAELVGRDAFQDLLSPGGQIYHETHYAPLLLMQGRCGRSPSRSLRADGSRFRLGQLGRPARPSRAPA